MISNNNKQPTTTTKMMARVLNMTTKSITRMFFFSHKAPGEQYFSAPPILTLYVWWPLPVSKPLYSISIYCLLSPRFINFSMPISYHHTVPAHTSQHLLLVLLYFHGCFCCPSGIQFANFAIVKELY